MRNSNELKRLRARCLALPETTETAAWGHPNFKAGKRTFVAYEIVNARPSIAFRLPIPDVDRLLARSASAAQLRRDKAAGFFATPYGRGQWVSVWADEKLDWAMVDDLVDRAYRTVALKRMLAARSKASS
jgi:predicted DNA-binding protein (MmcQ/YjbR family)